MRSRDGSGWGDDRGSSRLRARRVRSSESRLDPRSTAVAVVSCSLLHADVETLAEGDKLLESHRFDVVRDQGVRELRAKGGEEGSLLSFIIITSLNY